MNKTILKYTSLYLLGYTSPRAYKYIQNKVTKHSKYDLIRAAVRGDNIIHGLAVEGNVTIRPKGGRRTLIMGNYFLNFHYTNKDNMTRTQAQARTAKTVSDWDKGTYEMPKR